jgi:hypothetical protein
MTTPANPSSRSTEDDVDVSVRGRGDVEEETSGVALTTDDDSQIDDLPVKPDNA